MGGGKGCPMRTKRQPVSRRGDRRRHPDGSARTALRRRADAPTSRRRRPRQPTAPSPGREPRAPRPGPQTAAGPRPTVRPAPPKNTRQAKARAKARKAKAPKVVRTPLRERLVVRLASVDLRPRTLAAKVPFVVLVIGTLGAGLGITLWLSTDAAERSYQLGTVKQGNRALLQQKEALERDVREAQSAPALAEAARNLGMIPSRDTAHLVQDPAGNWVVVGNPTPAEGVPPPPLNTKLPEERPAPPPPPPRPLEVPIRESPGLGWPALPPGAAAPGRDVPLSPSVGAQNQHLPTNAVPAMPGVPRVPLTGPPSGPLPPVLSPAPPLIVIGSSPGPAVEQFSPPAASPSAAAPGAAR